MSIPFPGMDPYLEHPVLWEGVHTRLAVEIADQIQPRLDPRYVASVEERVYIAGPQYRMPDVRVHRAATDDPLEHPVATSPQRSGALVVEIEGREVHEKRVDILDTYENLRLVTSIEIVSPTNKLRGPGRKSYLQKQREFLERDCHLIEIDLLRRGRHVVAVPRWRVAQEGDYDYLVCVSRWPNRNRFELYPTSLRQGLPEISVPLSDSDPDVPLRLQDAIESLHEKGRYTRRLKYAERCVPRLSSDDQHWADEQVARFRALHPERFP